MFTLAGASLVLALGAARSETPTRVAHLATLAAWRCATVTWTAPRRPELAETAAADLVFRMTSE